MRTKLKGSSVYSSTSSEFATLGQLTRSFTCFKGTLFLNP